MFDLSLDVARFIEDFETYYALLLDLDDEEPDFWNGEIIPGITGRDLVELYEYRIENFDNPAFYNLIRPLCRARGDIVATSNEMAAFTLAVIDQQPAREV